MGLLQGVESLGFEAIRLAGRPPAAIARPRGHSVTRPQGVRGCDVLINLDPLQPLVHPRMVSFVPSAGRQTIGRPRYGWEHLSAREIADTLRIERETYAASVACAAATPWAVESLVQDYDVSADRCFAVGIGPAGKSDGATVVPHPAGHPRFAVVVDSTRPGNLEELHLAFAKVREVHPRASLDLLPADLDPLPLGLSGVPGAQRVKRGLGRGLSPRITQQRLAGQATGLIVVTSFDPVGLVNLKAAAQGIPSIVVADGGVADVLGDAGISIPRHDVAGLAGAMIHLAEPETQRAIRAAARARAALMTWPRVARRLLQVAGVLEPNPVDWTELFRPSRLGRPLP